MSSYFTPHRVASTLAGDSITPGRRTPLDASGRNVEWRALALKFLAAAALSSAACRGDGPLAPLDIGLKAPDVILPALFAGYESGTILPDSPSPIDVRNDLYEPDTMAVDCHWRNLASLGSCNRFRLQWKRLHIRQRFSHAGWSSDDDAIAMSTLRERVTGRGAASRRSPRPCGSHPFIAARPSKYSRSPIQFHSGERGRAGVRVDDGRYSLLVGRRSCSLEAHFQSPHRPIWRQGIRGQLGEIHPARRRRAPGPTTLIGVNCALGDSGQAYCWDALFSRHADHSNSSTVPVDGTGSSSRRLPQPARYALRRRRRRVLTGIAIWNPGGHHRGGVFCNRPDSHSRGFAFKAIAVGRAACGLLDDGTAYCWRKTPRLVSSSIKFTQIAVGAEYACGVSAAHGLYLGERAPTALSA